MRDINSLKENEAIHISTKKEAKKIAKLFGPEYHNHTLNNPARKAIFESFELYEYLSGISVVPVHFGKIVAIGSLNYYKSQNFNVYPASDFLPKKKKKVTREWVEKYVAKALYAKQTQEAVERALQPSKEQISDLVTTDPANLDVKGAEVVSGLEEDKSATIIESEKEIDWGKAGQKLISTYNDVVVLNSGSSSSDHFEATVISDPESAYYVGHYSSIWKKKSFTLYTGEPITLSNEN